jgi:hypothetical protein
VQWGNRPDARQKPVRGFFAALRVTGVGVSPPIRHPERSEGSTDEGTGYKPGLCSTRAPAIKPGRMTKPRKPTPKPWSMKWIIVAIAVFFQMFFSTLAGVVNNNTDRVIARSLAHQFPALSVKNDLKTDAEVRDLLETIK